MSNLVMRSTHTPAHIPLWMLTSPPTHGLQHTKQCLFCFSHIKNIKQHPATHAHFTGKSLRRRRMLCEEKSSPDMLCRAPYCILWWDTVCFPGILRLCCDACNRRQPCGGWLSMFAMSFGNYEMVHFIGQVSPQSELDECWILMRNERTRTREYSCFPTYIQILFYALLNIHFMFHLRRK